MQIFSIWKYSSQITMSVESVNSLTYPCQLKLHCSAVLSNAGHTTDYKITHISGNTSGHLRLVVFQLPGHALSL